MTHNSKEVETPAHEIIVASSKNEQQQCFDVRVNVFHHEQKFPLELEFDDKEDISTHILLRLIPSLEPIGTIRGYLVPGTKDTYKLTRLAILKEYRKYGFGRKLVEALHQWVEAHAQRAPAALSVSPFSAAAESNSDIKINGTALNSNVVVSITNNTGDQSRPTAQHQPATNGIKIVCHSQIYAKGFYSKFGYTPEGDEFIEDGDPHQKMVLRIPIPDLTQPAHNPNTI